MNLKITIQRWDFPIQIISRQSDILKIILNYKNRTDWAEPKNPTTSQVCGRMSQNL